MLPPSPAHILRVHRHPVLAVSHYHIHEIASDDCGLESPQRGPTWRRGVWGACDHVRLFSSTLHGTDGTLPRFGSHGRDNKIHVWRRPTSEPVSIRQGGAASLADQPPPPLCYSLDVNALNFCRFSLLPSPSSDSDLTALIAVPNLVESALADIWTLPNRTRLHAAIGDKEDTSATQFSDGRSGNKSGIIMSMHVYYSPLTSPSTSRAQRELRLLCGYEDGGVVLRRCTTPEGRQTVEGKGWEVVWKSRLHVESVMAMTVSKDCSFALTVSADHIVGRYELNTPTQIEADRSAQAFRTKHPGNGAISIRDDGRVCAVGGWDGRVRLYSTKSFKSLGTLVYHKENCHALAFASAYVGRTTNLSGGDEDEDDMTDEEKRQRGRWLIAAGKDCRVSIWALISFEKGTPV